MTYRTEFPDFDDAVTPAALAALGFADLSWRNDACPTFVAGERLRLGVFLDYVSPELREFPEGPRFAVYDCDDDGARGLNDCLMETNEPLALLALLRARQMGRAFADVLAEWFSEGEMAEVRRRNIDHTDDRICASHDFCDANEAMAEAFADVMGRAIDLGGPNEEPDCLLWGAAWDFAKTAFLTASADEVTEEEED